MLSCGYGLGRLNRQRGRCAISCLFVALRAVGLPCTRKLTSPSSMSTWNIFRCDETQRFNAWCSERFAPTDGWSARVGLPLVGLSRSAWHGSRTRRTEAGAEGAEEPPTIPKAFLRTPTRCVPRTVHSRKGNPTTTATTTMHPHARTHVRNARAHTHAHSHTPPAHTSHGPRALACAKTAVSLPV